MSADAVPASRLQVGQVEADQVVPQNEGRPIGELVELQQRFRQSAARMHQASAGISTHRAESVDVAILPANLQIERKTAGPKEFFCLRRRRTRVGFYMRPRTGWLLRRWLCNASDLVPTIQFESSASRYMPSFGSEQ